jgi:flavin reductase (DIM6/NTAB) family NADH-FMN oxidoreductase RutF
MECILDKEIIEEGKYSIIIGKVVHLEADDQYFKNGDMDFEAAGPLSMMAGDEGMYFTVPKDTGDYWKYTKMFIGDK